MNKPTFFQMMVPVIGAFLAMFAGISAITGVRAINELANSQELFEQAIPILDIIKQKLLLTAFMGPAGAALVAIGLISRFKGNTASDE